MILPHTADEHEDTVSEGRYIVCHECDACLCEELDGVHYLQCNNYPHHIPDYMQK